MTSAMPRIDGQTYSTTRDPSVAEPSMSEHAGAAIATRGFDLKKDHNRRFERLECRHGRDHLCEAD